MEMSEQTRSFQESGWPPIGGAAVFSHPDDVVSDPRLSRGEKKAILASWVSDARAVENAPQFRQLDNGAVVELDAILRALVSLDEAGPRSAPRRFLTRRRGAISSWLSRAGLPRGVEPHQQSRRW